MIMQQKNIDGFSVNLNCINKYITSNVYKLFMLYPVHFGQGLDKRIDDQED